MFTGQYFFFFCFVFSHTTQSNYTFSKFLGLVFIFPSPFSEIMLFTCNIVKFICYCLFSILGSLYPGWLYIFEYMKHDCVYMSQSCLKYTPRKECNSSSSILSHSHFFRSYPFAPSTQFYLFSSDYLYTFIFFNDFSILFSPITLYYLVYQEVPTPTAFSPL